MEVLLAAADPHVNDIGEADCEEPCSEFTSDSACDEGFATSRRSIHEKAPFEGLTIELAELWVTKGPEEGEVDELFDFGETFHVAEINLRSLHGEVELF
jgi:hypothetical protein